MAGNKKCHGHLVKNEIICFLASIFQTKFHEKYTNRAENAALQKTVKNILHFFARLVYHSAMASDHIENIIGPIFKRVEQHCDVDGTYVKDMMYINKKLNNSFGQTSFRQRENKKGIDNCATLRTVEERNNEQYAAYQTDARHVATSTLLESCV